MAKLVSPTGAVRYAITWPDGAVTNAWLHVTVKANARTGLAAPDSFAFGNLVGDAGGADLRVNAFDYAGARANVLRPSPLAGRYDFDRDGRVTLLDVMAARRQLFHALPAPPPPTDPATTATFASSRVTLASGLVRQRRREEEVFG